jgi:hypothetical protein
MECSRYFVFALVSCLLLNTASPAALRMDGPQPLPLVRDYFFSEALSPAEGAFRRDEGSIAYLNVYHLLQAIVVGIGFASILGAQPATLPSKIPSAYHTKDQFESLKGLIRLHELRQKRDSGKASAQDRKDLVDMSVRTTRASKNDPAWSEKFESFFAQSEPLLNRRDALKGSLLRGPKETYVNLVLDLDDQLLRPRGWFMIPDLSGSAGWFIFRISKPLGDIRGSPLPLIPGQERSVPAWDGEFMLFATGTELSKSIMGVQFGTPAHQMIAASMSAVKRAAKFDGKLLDPRSKASKDTIREGRTAALQSWRRALNLDGLVIGHHHLVPDYPDRLFKKILTHEFGHAMLLPSASGLAVTEYDEAATRVRDLFGDLDHLFLSSLVHGAGREALAQAQRPAKALVPRLQIPYTVGLYAIATAYGNKDLIQRIGILDPKAPYELENQLLRLEPAIREHVVGSALLLLRRELPGPNDWTTELPPFPHITVMRPSRRQPFLLKAS